MVVLKLKFGEFMVLYLLSMGNQLVRLMNSNCIIPTVSCREERGEGRPPKIAKIE